MDQLRQPPALSGLSAARNAGGTRSALCLAWVAQLKAALNADDIRRCAAQALLMLIERVLLTPDQAAPDWLVAVLCSTRQQMAFAIRSADPHIPGR
jgi:hypothetical protein